MISQQRKQSRAQFFSFFLVTEDVLTHFFADCARSTRLEGEVTSMRITQDSQYALINHSPSVRWLVLFLKTSIYGLVSQEIYLWDIHKGEIARKYSGQRQHRHVIRSCFGGIDNNFIASGSEGENKKILFCQPAICRFLMSKFFFLVRWKRICMESRHWCSPGSVDRSWKWKC